MNKTVFFIYSLLLTVVSIYAEHVKLESQLSAGMLVPDGMDNAMAAGIVFVVFPVLMACFHLGLHAVIYEFSVRRHKGKPVNPRIVLLQSGSLLLNAVRLLGYGWLIYRVVISFNEHLYPEWVYLLSFLVMLNYWVWILQMVKERFRPA